MRVMVVVGVVEGGGAGAANNDVEGERRTRPQAEWGWY